jgi:hypothetical protein
VRLLANQAELTTLVRDNCLYITTAEHAAAMQPAALNLMPGLNPGEGANPLQQTVHLKLDRTPLQTVLQDLERETGVKVVFDPQAVRTPQTAITLDVNGVTVETALRLLAEMAELKTVAVGNVVFVTTQAKAAKMETERAKDVKMGMQILKDSGLQLGLGFGGGAGIMGGNLGIAGGLGGIQPGLGGGGMFGLVGGLGSGAGPAVRIGQFPAPAKAEPPPRPAAKTDSPLHRLLTALALPVTFKDGIDPITPLKDVLELLRVKYKLPILVNEEAFKSALNQADVESQPVKLSPLTGVRLGTVLDKLLVQVQGAYLVRADHLEVTTALHAQNAIWGRLELENENPSSVQQRVRMPVVHAEIPNLPLSAALRELADRSGVSIVIDHHRAGDKAQATVSGPLTNVAVDTAVQLLADQVELELVVLDNALYVTTQANARALRAEQQRANQWGVEGSQGAAPGGAAQ